MELSVNLPDEDVALLDEYVRRSGFRSRSAALHHAIRLLRHQRLEEDYAAAWDEWGASGAHGAWEGAAGDGLAPAPR